MEISKEALETMLGKMLGLQDQVTTYNLQPQMRELSEANASLSDALGRQKDLVKQLTGIDNEENVRLRAQIEEMKAELLTLAAGKVTAEERAGDLEAEYGELKYAESQTRASYHAGVKFNNELKEKIAKLEKQLVAQAETIEMFIEAEKALEHEQRTGKVGPPTLEERLEALAVDCLQAGHVVLETDTELVEMVGVLSAEPSYIRAKLEVTPYIKLACHVLNGN